jgi:wyosine [tRNA(Phe)-imidazoG37] synthetase (radical SAM superfamily)
VRERRDVDPEYVTRFEVLGEVRDLCGLRARHRHALVSRHTKRVTFAGVRVGVGAIVPGGEPALCPSTVASTRVPS